MDEQIEVLRSIYSRPNELIVNEKTETIVFNHFDSRDQSIGFSLIIYPNRSIVVESQRLSNDEVKQLQSKTTLRTTLFDLIDQLKSFYEHLIQQRTNSTTAEHRSTSIVLSKIDHMRSTTIYMKNLRQWTNEFRLTGRVFLVENRIFLLFEGERDDLKVCFTSNRTFLFSKI